MNVKNLYFQHCKNAPFFFQNLSFNLEKGKMNALHGKNGTGKTILLNILHRKIDPQATVRGEFQDIGRAVLVNQRFDQMLADQFTFHENLQFARLGRFPNLFSRLQSPSYLLEVLERFSIDPYQQVRKLSGGQRQILALLMSLQQKTELLLLDEPTATMDEQNAEMVFQFLQTLTKKGMTLLVVCHDQDLVCRYTSGQHLCLETNNDGIRLLNSIQNDEMIVGSCAL